MRYPIFLDLTGQPVTVIGAGKVATRKIRSLLAAGAKVTVISPEATPAIQKLWEGRPRPDRLGQQGESRPGGRSHKNTNRRIRLLLRPYRQGDLRGARLVVAATDDPLVNERVCREARQRGLLVNCIAPPAAGNFIAPALVRRGRIELAISTGGASPAFAKQLRQELERFLTPAYVARLKRMARARHHD